MKPSQVQLRSYVPLALLLPLLGTACSTLKVERKDVEQVKKVAIIGFGLQQQQPNTVLNVLQGASEHSDSAGPHGMMAAPRAAGVAQPSEVADQIESRLAKSLAKDLGWQVVSREDLSNIPAYHQLLESKTTGFQFRPPASGKNMAYLRPNGVIETFTLGNLSDLDRQELMKQLGVDAVVLVDMNVMLENEGGLKSLIGAGDFHSKATMSFRVYNQHSNDPIWRDSYAEGSSTEQSVEHGLGFASVSKLDTQAVVASESAIQHLIRRYRESN